MIKNTINKVLPILLSFALFLPNTYTLYAQEEDVNLMEEETEESEESINEEEDISTEDELKSNVKIVEREDCDSHVQFEVTFSQPIFSSSIKLHITGTSEVLLEDPEKEEETYLFENDFDIGEYSVDYLLVDEEKIELDEPVSFTVIEDEITVENETYYTTYTGFDYTTQTNDPKRLAVLDKGKDMITFAWTAPFDIPTWKDQWNYASWATDINGVKSQYFIGGHTYTGLPYTLNLSGRTYDDVAWANLLKSSNLSYSTFGGSYTFYNGTTTYNTSLKGTDCCGFVCSCLNVIASTPVNLGTAGMCNSSMFVKVTGSTKRQRYDNMQPGDMLLNVDHVMLYAGSDDEYMYFFESLYNKSSILCTGYKEEWLYDDYDAYRFYELCDLQPVTVDPTYENYLPIKTYSNQTTLALYNENRKQTGTLSSSSILFSILDFYSDGMCKIEYSTSSGKKTAYARSTNFFSGSNLTKWTSNAQYTVYQTDTSTTTTEKLTKDKSCIILSTKNGRQEIIYQTSSGYYHGWIIPLSSQETMKGHSISLSGDICLNFYMELGDSITSNSNAVLKMTTPSGTQSVKISSATKNSSGYYIFPCKISAKDLTSTITAQLDLGNNLYGKKYSYKVETYANAVLNNPSAYASKTVSIVKSLMTYGYYVQQYFGYRTSNLPSKINTLTNKDLSKFKYVLSDQNSSVDFIGSRLVLSTKPGIKLYFTGDASFKVNGTSVTTTKEGKYTVITISDISNFEKAYTITTTNFSLRYYLFSYGMDSSNTKITNLMQALYAYDLSLK